MTIAAGFICSDGLLLCADSQQSDETTKYQREKIFAFEDCLICTGSGDSAFIKMTFDKLCDEFKSAKPTNRADARDISERTVTAVHEEHIYKFHQPGDSRRPYLQLILGARCQDGELALVKTVDDAAYLGGEYEATGLGQYLFEYWARLFYRNNLSMDVMLYIALFILREVKRNADGCGGYSRVLRMPKDAKYPQKFTWYDENEIFAGFPETMVRILSVLTDPSVPDQWIDERLEGFCKHLRLIREHAKQPPLTLKPSP